jgi:hypothetical protein
MYKKHNILDVFVELELRDKEGKLLRKRRFKSKTWVRNFMFTLDSSMGGPDQIQTTTGGWLGDNSLGVNAGANNDNFGIQVGTGTNPWAYDQYSLQTKISHGSGSGQMLYGACTVTQNIVITNGMKFVVSRVFTNGTSATITVKEIGLVAATGYVNYYKLLARDVLSPAIDVPAGSSLTVRYVIQWSWA